MMATTPKSSEHPPARRSSRVVVPSKLKWHGRLAAWSIHRIIYLLQASLRLRLEGNEESRSLILKQPVIFSIWHNRLALALPAYHRVVKSKQPERVMAAIVSASGDGALVARVLEHFGAQPVRGSTSRRGAQALRELVSQTALGRDLAITPDGPRGPCYRVQEGVIALAQLTGFPVIPTSYEVSRTIRLKSWDRFIIPLPFAQWNLRLGAPLWVPREGTEQDREQLRAELERRMKEITLD